jgi:hypothetical protein
LILAVSLNRAYGQEITGEAVGHLSSGGRSKKGITLPSALEDSPLCGGKQDVSLTSCGLMAGFKMDATGFMPILLRLKSGALFHLSDLQHSMAFGQAELSSCQSVEMGVMKHPVVT